MYLAKLFTKLNKTTTTLVYFSVMLSLSKFTKAYFSHTRILSKLIHLFIPTTRCGTIW